MIVSCCSSPGMGFTDINGHWAAGYINAIAAAGIIGGFGNGKFCPDQEVTATQCYKMLLVLIGYNAQKTGLVGSNWARTTLGLAATEGLTYNITGSVTIGMVSCPVIFLSGKSTSDDIVKGLSIGADDYVTKPFVVEELVARIHAHLRRQRRNFAGKTQMALQMGEIELNPAARAVSRGGVPVTLSTHEFDLLEYLMRNAGRTVSREEILRDVWKTTYGDIGVVAINIRNLRAKIDPEWAYIKTMMLSIGKPHYTAKVLHESLLPPPIIQHYWGWFLLCTLFLLPLAFLLHLVFNEILLKRNDSLE